MINIKSNIKEFERDLEKKRNQVVQQAIEKERRKVARKNGIRLNQVQVEVKYKEK